MLDHFNLLPVVRKVATIYNVFVAGLCQRCLFILCNSDYCVKETLLTQLGECFLTLGFLLSLHLYLIVADVRGICFSFRLGDILWDILWGNIMWD